MPASSALSLPGNRERRTLNSEPHSWKNSSFTAATASRHGQHQRLEKLLAAHPRRHAADRGRVHHPPRAGSQRHQLHDPDPQRARAPMWSAPAASVITCGGEDHDGRALRTRPQDARLDLRAWARCSAAMRRGHRLAARRLRHRRPPGRPAPRAASKRSARKSKIEGGNIILTRQGRPQAARTINLRGKHGPTVLGTDNVMMAAVLAEGHHRHRRRRRRAGSRRSREFPQSRWARKSRAPAPAASSSRA